MFQSLRIILAIALAVEVQHVNGDKRNGSSELLSAEDINFGGEGNNFVSSCVYENCSYNSFDNAMANLTSNIVIDITSDVMLSLFIKRSDLENVTIIGRNCSTVHCNNIGGVHFVFCRNCIIQGITWNECGKANTNDHNEPVLKLSSSFNVTIQNCTFQHSVGQVVVLSEMLGNVKINDCKFVNNDHYTGHGAAIHYSSNSSLLAFTISNCNFTNNKFAKSVIYIRQLGSRIIEHSNNNIYNSTFCGNLGSSIYVVNQNLNLREKILFQYNTADNGTGIYASDYSTVIFGKNSEVTFNQNSANYRGGTVFLRNNSTISFDNNSIVTFNDNSAIFGTIYAEGNSNVTFKGNCQVTFSHNSVSQYGSAICSLDNSYVTFTGNSKVVFKKNFVSTIGNYEVFGGTIYSRNYGHIGFEGFSTTVFSNNSASNGGGAITSYDNSHISFRGNSTTMFSNNIADDTGGAIYSEQYSYVSFEENSTILFSNNIADYGGAMFSYNHSNMSFKNYSTVKFITNIAAQGGAIYSRNCNCIYFEGYSTTLFNNNSAGDTGGAINSYDYCHIYFEGNSTTVFINNTASDTGGAVYSENYSQVSFKGNSSTAFRNNIADYGGAINSYHYNHIYFEGNSTTLFSNNSAANYGAAINSYDYCSISFKRCSNILFSNNSAVEIGGAINSNKYSQVSFEENSTAAFTANSAADYGGAIYSEEHGSILFKENSTTIFSKNNAAYGGALWSYDTSRITFLGCSLTRFTNNRADRGGAVALLHKCNVTIAEHSVVVFSQNIAQSSLTSGGAALHFSFNSSITIKGNSNVTFNNNYAIESGGVVYCEYAGFILTQNSTITLSGNKAKVGGALHLVHNCDITFKENSMVKFINNIATSIGGAAFATEQSDITFDDNSSVTFTNNTAPFGGTLYSKSRSTIIAKGDSSVMFNNLLANWCTGICMPYAGQSNVISINSIGMVRCSNQKEFICVSKKCRCKRLEDLLVNITSSMVININEKIALSSVIQLTNLRNISLIGHNNPTVICVDDGGLQVKLSSNLTIKGIIWIGFDTRNIIEYTNPVIELLNSSDTIILNCSFQHSKGRAIQLSGISGNTRISYCNFMNNNQYSGHGIAIHYSSNDLRNSQLVFTITKCNFTHTGGATSVVYLGKSTTVQHISLSESIFYNNHGVSIFLSNTNLHIDGDVLFANNIAENGPGIYITDHSTVTFDKNSDVKFIQNFANYKGGAVFLRNHSNVLFDHNSVVNFSNNNATNGTIYSEVSSTVTFKADCQVTFNSNSAYQNGAAVCSMDNSYVTFTGKSNVTFSNNSASQSGGAMYCDSYQGFVFKENSVATFSGNKATDGGAMYCLSMCKITFMGNSTLTFIDNAAINTGGAMVCKEYSDTIVEGRSVVTFDNNTADNGGSLYFTNSIIVFKGRTKVMFSNNKVKQHGGAGYFGHNCRVAFDESTIVIFGNNVANQNAGTIYSTTSTLVFEGNSFVTFHYSTATLNGGALYSDLNSNILFSKNSKLIFNSNKALCGGAVFANTETNVTFEGNTLVKFINNDATQHGGTGYFKSYCNIMFTENATIIFANNKASNGGAACFDDNTNIMFKKNSNVLFNKNIATVNGGATSSLSNSAITFNGNTTVTFVNNSAKYGTGGAMFFDVTQSTIVLSNGVKGIHFINNNAKIAGNSVYLDVAKLCNSSCINNRIMGMSREHMIYKFISTPPSKLQFNKPAYCISDHDTDCSNYYVPKVMLGKEIVIPACLLDYYDQPADTAQFLVHGKRHQNYFTSGSKQVLISCDTFEGISVIGNKSLRESLNYSVTVTLNADNPDWKQISVKLIIELTPCHSGFWQYPKSLRCECYNASDIVFCSGSDSTIKRGYWFGSVMEKPTVTLCPINYCNFTCCETSNGYYHLSPVRDNQCMSHRSGTACGNCMHGYTLSFDSSECVNVENCTAVQTVLIVILTVIYWTIMMIVIFGLMYYKVGIGYLYSITYYYSVVDILLSQNMYVSGELYLAISIMSSFAKITPQFLGELCLTTEMSGIDQQFIHYMHPMAVILILLVITLLARRSPRFSAIISRGIIHVICLLLLLSYTSIASTSLLLMRSLTFVDVDRIYTYLSPDIEYFHGRHLLYGIIALLCIISIVIGLPLLLTLEPFLNCKFNFTKIKPLLDQFQGCYKDKYRCFAGYYMICRLVIITILIINSPNDFVTNYMLVTVCGIIHLIHLLVKPYSIEILNKFDSIILHLIIFIAALPLFDYYVSPLVITVVFILVILPLLLLFAMIYYLHKDNIKNRLHEYKDNVKNMITNCIFIRAQVRNNTNYTELPINDFGLTIDDSMRKNATVLDM